jgi:hypothetical protein
MGKCALRNGLRSSPSAWRMPAGMAKPHGGPEGLSGRRDRDRHLAEWAAQLAAATSKT